MAAVVVDRSSWHPFETTCGSGSATEIPGKRSLVVWKLFRVTLIYIGKKVRPLNTSKGRNSALRGDLGAFDASRERREIGNLQGRKISEGQWKLSIRGINNSEGGKVANERWVANEEGRGIRVSEVKRALSFTSRGKMLGEEAESLRGRSFVIEQRRKFLGREVFLTVDERERGL